MVLGALPGIREVRSALAGGYLWIAFLWLALDPTLGSADFKGEPFHSAHHLGNEVGPVALGVTMTFVAYLVGTFFNEARGVIARIYLRARQSASGARPVERREALEAIIDKRRQRGQDRRQLRLQRLLDRREGRLRVSRRLGDLSRSTVSTRVVYQAARATVEAFTLLGRLSEALTILPVLLAEILSSSLEAVQQIILAPIRWMSSIRIEPYKPFISGNGVAAIERYLRHEKDARHRIAWGGTDGNWQQPTIADVIADFPIVRTRLIHKSPDTVAEYDRLRAEADFRSAIVPPLFAILILFVAHVAWLWGLATLLLLVLLASARQKRREAGDILADTLGVVHAPCVEDAGSTQTPKSSSRSSLAAPQGI